MEHNLNEACSSKEPGPGEAEAEGFISQKVEHTKRVLQDEKLPKHCTEHIFKALDTIKSDQDLSRIALLQMHAHMSRVNLHCYESYAEYSRMLEKCSERKESPA